MDINLRISAIKKLSYKKSEIKPVIKNIVYKEVKINVLEECFTERFCKTIIIYCRGVYIIQV